MQQRSFTSAWRTTTSAPIAWKPLLMFGPLNMIFYVGTSTLRDCKSLLQCWQKRYFHWRLLHKIKAWGAIKGSWGKATLSLAWQLTVSVPTDPVRRSQHRRPVTALTTSQWLIDVDKSVLDSDLWCILCLWLGRVIMSRTEHDIYV